MSPMSVLNIILNKIWGRSSVPIVVDSDNGGDMRCSPDWSDLLPELLAAIAFRLPFMEDFAAFREVCKPWRAAATKDTFRKGVSKIPFLMLVEKDGGGDDRQLFSLYKNTVWKTMSFPAFRNKKCIDAGFGWVLVVAADGWEANLVELSTCATVELPSLTIFPGRGRDSVRPAHNWIRNGILSADPSRTKDSVLMVNTPRGLAYWSPGWSNWRMVDTPTPRSLFGNIGYCKGRMLDINYSGFVRMRDPSAVDFTVSEFIVKVNLSRHGLLYMKPYFVESSSGDLLLIFRSNVNYGEYGAHQFRFNEFKVARIDIGKGEYEMVEGGIGNDAVFVGENAAVCVDAGNFPGVIKPNCVYYTDDCSQAFWKPDRKPVPPYVDRDTGRRYEDFADNRGGGRDMGIYTFEDGSIERFPIQESLALSYLCPPLWIFPSF